MGIISARVVKAPLVSCKYNQGREEARVSDAVEVRIVLFLA